MKNMMIKSLVATAILSSSFAVFAASANADGGLMEQMMSKNNQVSAVQGDLSGVQIHTSGHHNGGLMEKMTPVKVTNDLGSNVQEQLHNVYVKPNV